MVEYTQEAYKLLHQGTLALAEVEKAGMRIDTEYLDRKLEDSEAKIKQLQTKLKAHKFYKLWKKLYGDKMTLGSRPQLMQVLIESDVVEEGSLERTAKGNIKADKKILEQVDHPFVQVYLKIEAIKKARNTYLKGLKREVVDGFIHPSFSLIIPVSYRGSCYNPNAQNIPRRNEQIAKLVRRCFIPREGHVLVEIDFKGVEVSISCCYNKDPVLIEYVKDETKDMHRDMAASCFACKTKQVSKRMRDITKNMFVFPQFYGSVYQQCAAALWDAIDQFDLQLENETPLHEHLETLGITRCGSCEFDESPKQGTFEAHLAKVEKTFWESRFKVYAEWKNKWWEMYQRKGYVKYLTGFVVRGLYKRNEIINYAVQGTAFHCLLWCLIHLVRHFKKHKMQTRVICQIHDSVILDVHKDEFDYVLEFAQRLMSEKITNHWKWIVVPLVVEMELAERNWFGKVEIKI